MFFFLNIYIGLGHIKIGFVHFSCSLLVPLFLDAFPNSKYTQIVFSHLRGETLKLLVSEYIPNREVLHAQWLKQCFIWSVYMCVKLKDSY